MQNLKPPAYQEYAATMLATLSFRAMTLQDRGLLYTMRLECWVNMKLPGNHNDLAKVLGLPVTEVEKSLDIVMSFFTLQDGFIICPDLEDYRKHLTELRQKQSQGGKRGSAITNSKRHTKTKNDNTESNLRVPRQDSNESLVQSSTVKPSQAQSIKKGVGLVNNDWASEYAATEALENNFK